MPPDRPRPRRARSGLLEAPLGRGGNKREAVDGGGMGSGGEIGLAGEDIFEEWTRMRWIGGEAEPAAGGALRVAIDQEDLAAGLGEAGGEVDGGGGLADAASVVRDGEDAQEGLRVGGGGGGGGRGGGEGEADSEGGWCERWPERISC